MFFKTFDLDEADYTRRYSLGKMIKVHYDPANEDQSVLEKGTRPEIQLLIVYALILLAMACFAAPL